MHAGQNGLFGKLLEAGANLVGVRPGISRYSHVKVQSSGTIFWAVPPRIVPT